MRQKVPIDLPDRIPFPAGAHVKVTNTGTQIVYISDTPDALFQTDPGSNTPLQGMPLSPDKTETWWGPEELWIRCALPGGEIEASFSLPMDNQPVSTPIQPGYRRTIASSVRNEYTSSTMAPALRGIVGAK